MNDNVVFTQLIESQRVERENNQPYPDAVVIDLRKRHEPCGGVVVLPKSKRPKAKRVKP